MTPKEKAQELVNKYLPIVNGAIWVKPKIKECALITVNEILKENLELPDEPETVIRYLFWQKVKNEIEA